MRYVRGPPNEYDAILITDVPARPDRHVFRQLGLTARQAEVLGLLCRGHASEQIADTLGVSRRTVDHHLEAIYKRLDVHSRDEATRKAARMLPAGPHPARDARDMEV